MANQSSRRIHLGKNSKRTISNLSLERCLEFSEALEQLASDPEPDGKSKVSLGFFPYQPEIIGYANLGFWMTYKFVDDELYVASVHDRG